MGENKKNSLDQCFSCFPLKKKEEKNKIKICALKTKQRNPEIANCDTTNIADTFVLRLLLKKTCGDTPHFLNANFNFLV